MTNEPFAAGIIFSNAGKVLLMLRPEGLWGIPAGKIEIGETPEQCAVRETVEETGHVVMRADALTLLDVSDGFVTYVCNDGEFVPVLNDEHSAFIWADRATMPSPIFPGLAENLESCLSSRTEDLNGYWTIKANPVSKAGIFSYVGAKLPGAPEPDRIYRVYRPVEELAMPETLASIRLLPWMDDHAMLGKKGQANTVPAEQKTISGVTGENVYVEGDTLYANLKLFSESFANLIDSGKKELSLGYRARYDWSPGTCEYGEYDCVQRNLRGNHLALVGDGRCGPEVAVLDSYHFTLDSKDFDMKKSERAQLQMLLAKHTRGVVMDASDDEENKDKPDAKPAAATDGGDATPDKKPGDAGAAGGEVGEMTMSEAVAALEELMPLLAKLCTAAGIKPPEIANPDTTTPAAGADTIVTDHAATMDAAIKRAIPGITLTAMQHIAARDALASRLSEHVGVFDHADKTLGEVVKYGLEKLAIKAPVGMEAATLDGYLLGKPAPRAAATAHVMDGADKDNAVTRHMKALSAKRV